jgi:HEAT repeat protein
MVELLLKTETGRDRDELEKAIMFVCNRIGDPDERPMPVLEAILEIGPADSDVSDAQASILLPLLGRIGGNPALEVIQDALKLGKPEVQDAAVRALSNWPNADVADQLAAIAETSANESHRVWALRAYVRVVTADRSRPGRQTLAMLTRAMDLATRDDERRLILGRAAAARVVETLRWVVPYLDRDSLRRDASRAVVELARHRDLMSPNRDEFVTALNKVTKLCKDQGLVDRAREYVERE